MKMTLKQHVDYWLKLSNDSILDMRAAYRSGRRTNALFCGHLAIEKTLKAFCAVRLVPAQNIWGHSLFKLASSAGLWEQLSATQQTELATITTFNIEARYDGYKRHFAQLCTPPFTKQWVAVIETWYSNLKQQILTERALLPNNVSAE